MHLNFFRHFSGLGALLGLLAAVAPALAQEEIPAEPVQRPRIGLVLGGGGAKGAAHIGVLRVLEELKVPVDCVTGTSMGALVGATFASGMPPEDIEAVVAGIDWSRTVGSEGLRNRTPINRKLEGITYTNGLELGFKNGGIKAPGGLLRTQDIEDVIRGLVSDARYTQNFNALPIPFRAIATDMLSGEMVVLDAGDISVAMRASMAVPGAFSPVVIDGRVLSDGGMMRNLPVDVARDLCADVVIAVSLSSPPPTTEDLLSAVTLAGRSLDVMIDANQRAQLETLTERDVSIAVPMGVIGSTSFEMVPSAIPLGREAALKQKEKLLRYAVPESEYLAWQQRVQRPDTTPMRLAEVRITGLDRVNPEYVKAQLRNLEPGREVTISEIVEDTSRIYALGDFEKVSYQFSGPGDARVLDINAKEKSWGPNFLRFDLGLAANGDGTLQAILRAEHFRTWINSYGGQWHNAVQIGDQTLIETDFYQPMDIRQRFFVQPSAQFERDLEDIYLDGDRIARYFLEEGYGQLDVGANFGTRAQLRAGMRQGWVSATLDTGIPGFPDSPTQKDSSVHAQVIYDTRNSVGLPTDGTFINTRYVHSGSSFGGELSYDLAEGVIAKSYPWRGDALTLFLSGGAELSGELPLTQEFQLGGIRTFPGLQPGELRGDSFWYTGARYNWKLADIASLFGQAIYAGLRLQAGRIGGNPIPEDREVLRGISGSFSGLTPIGPFIVSLGWVDDNTWALQFGLGRPLDEGSILDELR